MSGLERTQLLPQGEGRDANVFVGYGLSAVMTEYSANGSVLCDMHFGSETSWERGDIQSYRAYKFNWVGQPTYPPIAVIKGDRVLCQLEWSDRSPLMASAGIRGFCERRLDLVLGSRASKASRPLCRYPMSIVAHEICVF